MNKEAAEEKLNAAVIARIKKLRADYYSKPRNESLRRFIRRITKPKAFRYQSLLLGAFRAKNRERHGIKYPKESTVET